MSCFRLYNVYKNYSFLTGWYSLLKCTIGVIFVYPCAAYHELGACSLDSSYQSMRSTAGHIIPNNAEITPIAVFEISITRKNVPVHEFVQNIPGTRYVVIRLGPLWTANS